MDRLIAPYTVAQAQADTAPATGTPGYATDGNPATNTPATQWPAYQYNAIQEELMGVILAAGLAPSRTALNQLLLAIRALSAVSQGVLVDTGAANAYAAANAVPLATATLVHSVRQRITIGHTNTGASTYAPDGLPAKPIYGLGLQPLQGMELIATQIADLEYVVAPSLNSGNGAWILLGCGGGALQVAAATQSFHAAQFGQIAPIYSISAIPTTQVAPAIQVIEAGEVWPWQAATTNLPAGYRSVRLGEVDLSIQPSPWSHQIEARGATYSKTTYARLWGWAKDKGYVVASGSWVAGAYAFIDLGGDNFQAPDLRNQFLRADGTDADTANARAVGSKQTDAFQNITGDIGVWWNVYVGSNGAFTTTSTGQGTIPTATGANGAAARAYFNASNVARTSSETRGINTAMRPVIHA